MIPSESALRSPNRIRLSTYNQFNQLRTSSILLLTYIYLPLVILNATRLGIPEWITTTVQMDLSSGLLVASN